METERKNNSSEISQNTAGHKEKVKGKKPKVEFKKYPCDVCSREFLQTSLKTHMRTHTGEKPYTCNVCGKAFARNNVLANHKRTHTGEKSYPCPICGKTFSQSHSLAAHNRTHTGEKPYKCNICEKAFSQRIHLTSHKRIHSGEKPYQCNICEKEFSRSSHLTLHKRTHTGEKPYSCDMCKKSYSQLSGLYYHNKSAAHVKRKTSVTEDPQSAPNSFTDCGEGIKLEIKVEETLDEDPLSTQMEAEENIVNKEDMVNYEDIDFPVFGYNLIEEIKLETNKENSVDKDLEQSDVHEEELNKSENIGDEHNGEDGDNVSNQDLNAMNGGEGNDNNVYPVLENLTHEEALAYFS